MEADLADALGVHLVWVPMLGAREEHVAPATPTAGALPARQYWDGQGLLVEGYRDVLGLDGPAWDVYLLYGPDVVWEEDAIPAPAYWMHQLGNDAPGPRLDRHELADAAVRLGGDG